MDRSLTRHSAPRRLGTASLVLVAFGAGHLAAKLGASIVVEASVAIVLAAAAVAHRRTGRSTDQPTDQPSINQPSVNQPSINQPIDQPVTVQETGRTAPNGVNTFDVVCSPPASEGALAVIRDVIDSMVRPTDLVVRHTDGRLLVLVDAAGDDVRESFESRANVHVHVALAAAGMGPIGLTLRPVDASA